MRYRMLFIMTGSQMCASVVQQGFGSLGPFIVGAFHVNKAQLGLCFSAVMLGSALAAGLGGAAVDRFGERRVTFVAGVTIFASLCLAASIPSYAGLVAGLFVVGVSYAATAPAGGRAILSWFDKERGFAMSFRQTGVPAGAVLGGIILPFLAVHFDYRIALVTGGLFALFGTAGLSQLYRDPPDLVRAHGDGTHYIDGIRAIVADPRAILATCACLILSGTQQVANGFIALSAVVLGHTGIAVAALAFSIAQIAGILGRISWGWASDVIFRGDRMMPLAIVSVLTGVGAAGVAFTSPSNVPLLLVASFVVGFTGVGWNGLYASALVEIAGPRFAGGALGLGATCNFAAAAVSPFVFGAVSDARGLTTGWLIVALCCVLASIPALLARRAFAAKLEGGRFSRA